MIYGIITLALGLVSIYFILSSDEKKDKLRRLVKYAGIAGMLLGIWGLISCMIDIGMTSGQMLIWITRLVVSLELATLGIMMTLWKNNSSPVKIIMPTMGIIGIGLGLCQIIVSVISWPDAIIY